MHHNGWDFAVSEHRDYGMPSFAFACRHREAKLYMYTNPIPREEVERCKSDPTFTPSVVAIQCAHEVSIHLSERPNLSAIDFTPSIVPMSEVVSLEDLMPFCGVDAESEVFIPKEEIWTVQKHLSAVAEMQKDKQKELREKARKRQKDEARFMAGSDSKLKLNTHKDVELKLIAVG